MYPSDFARELEVKCSRGQVRITADSQVKKSQVRYREMTCFFFFFFFLLSAMYTHAHQLPVQVQHAYCMRPAIMER